MAPDTVGLFDIAVIGAGIGGIGVALDLLKHGFKVTIYESITSFSEIRGGITLPPNARKAYGLIDPQLWEHVDNSCSRNLNPNDKANVTYRLGYEDASYSSWKAEDIFSAHVCEGGQITSPRNAVLLAMYKLIPEGIVKFGSKVKRIENLDGPSEGVRLHFRDGSEATHGAVIGADGIHSLVRKHILGADDPASVVHYSGKFIHRGVIPLDKAREELGADRVLNSILYVGPGKFVVTLPVSDINSVFVWYATDNGDWPHDDWVVTYQKHGVDLHKQYEGWCPTVQKVNKIMTDWDLWALFDTHDAPASTYYKGNAVMLGDAAHATCPALGAGASMAIKDAYILGELMGHAKSLGSSLQTAFRAFDLVRRPRTQYIVDTSREAANVWSFNRPGIDGDLDKMRLEVEGRSNYVWQWDDEKELREGRKLVEAQRFGGGEQWRSSAASR
ncbi:MAG: hypothetical protein Q9162_004344 [Coniocarpon cinnabarinum]